MVLLVFFSNLSSMPYQPDFLGNFARRFAYAS
jgi:hypothetical protein